MVCGVCGCDPCDCHGVNDEANIWGVVAKNTPTKWKEHGLVSKENRSKSQLVDQVETRKHNTRNRILSTCRSGNKYTSESNI